ncbi:MAG: cytidine deaminase [Erysipelotrichaceae bacterium]|nr:cytidine deaminase [Erysipelotrichaceae bacterium]
MCDQEDFIVTNEELVKEAFKAMDNAYAPYSNYHVGACVLCKDGTTFWGANIENASYGGTNCGERSAVFAAYSRGYRKDDIEAIAIVSDGKRIGAPCGICRQVLSELLNQDTPIVLSNGKETVVTNIRELLPFQFSSEDLD